MTVRHKNLATILKASCLFVSGLAIGWLVGLSISPIIQVVLTSVVSLVVAFSSALAGLTRDEPEQLEEPKRRSLMMRAFNPLPIMCMVLGLAVGSSAGVYARSHNWLGVSGPSITSQWRETGLSDQEIARRIFDSAFPEPAKESKTLINQADNPAQSSAALAERDNVRSTKQNTLSSGAEITQQRAGAGVLFTEELNQCRRLLNIDDEEELRREMASSTFRDLVSLARECRELKCLTSGVNKACERYR